VNNNFRILALSGGGYRGLYAAKVLADLEEQTKQPIGRYFDLIAGTSIGGIVALAVAHEIPMKDVVDMFVEHGQNIFKKQRFSFFSILKSTYGSEQLKTEISRLFLDDKIGGAFPKKCVTAYNPLTGE
jgi:patatin-like phospholipase/acyl hydrolase